VNKITNLSKLILEYEIDLTVSLIDDLPKGLKGLTSKYMMHVQEWLKY